jgi:hypothetical protein
VRREPLPSEEAVRAGFDTSASEFEPSAADLPPLPATDEAPPDFEVDAGESVEEPKRSHRGAGGRSLFGRRRRGPAEPAGPGEPAEAPSEPSIDGPGGYEPPAVHDRDEWVAGASGSHAEEPWEEDDEFDEEGEYDYELEDDELESEGATQTGPGTVAFHPPDQPHERPPAPSESSAPPPHRGTPAPSAGPMPAPGDAPLTPTPPPPADDADLGETAEYDMESELAPPTPAPPREPAERRSPEPPVEGEHESPRDEDVLEETPEFLQDTPDHDRLWFEQRPPRDFDFDG